MPTATSAASGKPKSNGVYRGIQIKPDFMPSADRPARYVEDEWWGNYRWVSGQFSTKEIADLLSVREDAVWRTLYMARDTARKEGR